MAPPMAITCMRFNVLLIKMTTKIEMAGGTLSTLPTLFFGTCTKLYGLVFFCLWYGFFMPFTRLNGTGE